MPTLLELQQTVYRGMVVGDCERITEHIIADGLTAEARLNVYRNTFIGVLVTALRLSFPAVHRLVGAPFFESAARIFIEANPPRCAYLNDYGAEFPTFMADFKPAGSLVYLPGVARLEWAVNRALHAPDVNAIDLAKLSDSDGANHGTIRLVPHPSIGLVHADHPVDAIWRAVLAQDEDAMAAVDLEKGPVWLLVERRELNVEVTRMSEPLWGFMTALTSGASLQDVIETNSEIDAVAALAEHLAAARFVDVEFVGSRNLFIAQDLHA